jgi:DNA-binding SARP family transcriptional activator
MRAHAAAGNRAEALRTFEECRRPICDHLGVAPSANTENVYLDNLRSR